MSNEPLIEATRHLLGNAQTRISVVAMTVLTLSIFGPYVVGSLRTDQLVTYLCLVVLVPLNLRRVGRRGGRALIWTWGSYLIVAVLAAVPPPVPGEPWERGSFAAGLDNLALPLAVMLIVRAVVPRETASSALMVVGRLLTTLMAFNAIIAAFSTQIDLSPILRPFWANSSFAVTVAENAASNGRYSGIFNHPAEAGVLYAVAGLLVPIVWRQRNQLIAPLLVVIIAGGFLTVSKVFLIGGLPLIVLYWLISIKGGWRIRLKSVLAFAGWSTLAVIALRDWSGIPYLVRLVLPLVPEGQSVSSEGQPISPTGEEAPTVTESLVELYSAGRFTEGSELTMVVQEFLEKHTLWGVGAGGWQVPYDSGWVEALVVAGVLGAMVYGFALLWVFSNALLSGEGSVRVFGMFLAVFLAGASLGIPALTANRVALGVWLVISLLALLTSPTTTESAVSDPIDPSAKTSVAA